MAQWYYMKDDKKQGPVSSAELKQMAARGVLTPEDMIWRKELPDWIPAARATSLFANAAAGRSCPPPPRPRPTVATVTTAEFEDEGDMDVAPMPPPLMTRQPRPGRAMGRAAFSDDAESVLAAQRLKNARKNCNGFGYATMAALALMVGYAIFGDPLAKFRDDGWVFVGSYLIGFTFLAVPAASIWAAVYIPRRWSVIMNLPKMVSISALIATAFNMLLVLLFMVGFVVGIAMAIAR